MRLFTLLVTASSAGKCRKGRPTKPKKVRRRMSDAEKPKENNNSYQNKIRLENVSFMFLYVNF